MTGLKVYIRELAFACAEASLSDDPRVLDLALDLLAVAAGRFRSRRNILPVVCSGPRPAAPPGSREAAGTIALRSESSALSYLAAHGEL